MKDLELFLLDKFTKSEYVINSDSFDRRTYYSLKQNSQYLQEKEIEGCQKLYTFSPLICDVFCAFYKYNPNLRSRIEIKPLYFLNRRIMKGVLKTKEYEKLRANTHFDKLTSIWATESFMKFFISYLDKFSNEKIKKFFNRFNKMIKPWPGMRQKGKEDADAVISGNSPKEKQKKEKGTREEITKREMREIAKLMEEDFEEIKEALTQIVVEIMEDVAEEIDDMKSISFFCCGWGLEEGTLRKLDHSDRIELAKKFRENDKLKKIAELVGHFQELAITKQQLKFGNLPHEIFNVTLGRDLDRLLSSELVNLIHPYLKYDFYSRYIDGKLNQYEMRNKESMGKGSIIICIDCSGSMTGDKEIVAKAIGLGLLEIARFQKRNFVGILFGSPGEKMAFCFPKEEKKIVINRMIDFAAYFFGGGTDYETPLKEAISYIKEDQFNDGDIIFLTDGICDVTEEFLMEYKDVKMERKFFTYSILIGDYPSGNEVLKKISDQVILAENLNEEIAGGLYQAI